MRQIDVLTEEEWEVKRRILELQEQEKQILSRIRVAELKLIKIEEDIRKTEIGKKEYTWEEIEEYHKRREQAGRFRKALQEPRDQWVVEKEYIAQNTWEERRVFSPLKWDRQV